MATTPSSAWEVPAVARENFGASITVNNAGQLGEAIADLFDDPPTATDIGRRGYEIVQQNRGALGRLLKLLAPLISRD